ncbi:twisted gastrulation protein homolog 1 [Bombina bombina]|uniref:twisted gastrulation protein homolog 1 n=1 Tax=Bombina bombina TaxID=8345 RepID=UPI00235AFDFB|nr:twisted gastrulation protein homolog 1 [Bombina bombina]XP_053558311.1 twisted gastrulation protein homolog 1 [Bombina bombina]XP_053558312.1 twisted gastrulation protein homolog 1 [Bombina bombina]
MWQPIGLLSAVIFCLLMPSSSGCNKALCASDVSKCLLQELCQCYVKGDQCPCCQECMLCLDTLWEQCCDCVGLCKENRGRRRQAAQRSSVEMLPIPVPSLFRALSTVQDEDSSVAWRALSLPVTEELAQRSHKDHILLSTHSAVMPTASLNASVPCTVLYINRCMSMRHCHHSCESTGSSAYRWFHNGCCQCVGPDCHGYGSKEPACQQCRP